MATTFLPGTLGLPWRLLFLASLPGFPISVPFFTMSWHSRGWGPQQMLDHPVPRIISSIDLFPYEPLGCGYSATVRHSGLAQHPGFLRELCAGWKCPDY